MAGTGLFISATERLPSSFSEPRRLRGGNFGCREQQKSKATETWLCASAKGCPSVGGRRRCAERGPRYRRRQSDLQVFLSASTSAPSAPRWETRLRVGGWCCITLSSSRHAASIDTRLFASTGDLRLVETRRSTAKNTFAIIHPRQQPHLSGRAPKVRSRSSHPHCTSPKAGCALSVINAIQFHHGAKIPHSTKPPPPLP